jgi:hypothetical protein
MEDEELVRLNNACADLLALKKWEGFPRHLLTGGEGTWVNVSEICGRIGIDPGATPVDLFVTWLPEPTAEGFAVILFYDASSSWTMTANYNRERLFAAAEVGGNKQKISKSA